MKPKYFHSYSLIESLKAYVLEFTFYIFEESKTEKLGNFLIVTG